MKILPLATLLSFSLYAGNSQSICTDRPYFNYECSQLATYCRVSRAVGIRSSCPLTCGLCQKDQPRTPPVQENDLNRGIVRLLPTDLEDQSVTRPMLRSIDTSATNGLPPGVVILDGPAKLATESGLIGQPGYPSTPTRSLSDAEASDKFTNCCAANLIGSSCISMCSYDVKKEEALLKAASGLCTLDDAKIWVRCAADGYQNAECCRSRGVTGCDDACNGQLSSDTAQLLGCLHRFFDPIVSCHRENLH